MVGARAKWNLMQFKYQSSLGRKSLNKWFARQEMIKEKPLTDHVVQFVSVLSPIPKLQLTVLTIGHEWGDDPKPASSCKHCPKCHYVGMLEKV